MLVGLADVAVRDDVIVSLVGAPPPGVTGDDASAWAMGEVFQPGGRAPDVERTAAATLVLEETARCAARGTQAPALVLLAWLAWWTGAGATADVVVHQVLAEEPGHTLATLVAGAVRHGLPPGWART
jgi:hypothetical protein